MSEKRWLALAFERDEAGIITRCDIFEADGDLDRYSAGISIVRAIDLCGYKNRVAHWISVPDTKGYWGQSEIDWFWENQREKLLNLP